MIEKMLGGKYSSVDLYHVPMRFSWSASEVGRFRWRKVLHLLQLLVVLTRVKARTRAKTLYYPPASPNVVPLIRDLALLIFARLLFPKIILHFQAAGISDLYDRLSPILKPLFRMAYFHADAGIRVATRVPNDSLKLRARRDFTILNGVEDEAADSWRDRHWKRPPRILYMGTVNESKGVLDLLSAANELAKRGLEFELDIVGAFESDEFKSKVYRFIETRKLGSTVSCRGLLLDAPKRNAFLEAQVFCFPSYYSAEACPLVLIEAMQFALPIVTTMWRGIPDLVLDGVNGFLVHPRDPDSLSDRLEMLIANPWLSLRMGKEGRRIYENRFTLARFRNELDDVFSAVVV